MVEGPARIESQIAMLWEAGGTDLHLSAGACPMLRVNGELQAAEGTSPLSPAEMEGLVDTLVTDGQLEACQRLVPRVDGGQVAAFEVLMASSPVRNLIKDGRTNQLRNQFMVGHREGMVTLEESFNSLIRDGVISRDQAVARSAFPNDLLRD